MTKSVSTLWVILAVCAITCASPLHGQINSGDVSAGPEVVDTYNADLVQGEEGEMRIVTAGEAAETVEQAAIPSKWTHAGTLRASLSGSQKVSGSNNPDPRFGLNLGGGIKALYGSSTEAFISLGYAPQFNISLSDDDAGSLSQRLEGRIYREFAKVTLDFRQDYRYSSEADLDFGDASRGRHLVGTLLDMSYSITEKSVIGLELQQRLKFSEGANSSQGAWKSELYYDRKLATKMRLGVGAGFGYQTSGDDSITSERIQFRLGYDATAKLSLSLKAGVEFKQSGDGYDRVKPAFSLSMNHRISEKTSWKLSVYETSYLSSAEQGSEREVMGVETQIRQQIGAKITAHFGLGWEHANYQTVNDTETESSGREDDYLVARSHWAYSLGARSQISLSYQYRQAFSSDVTREFGNHRADLGYIYSF